MFRQILLIFILFYTNLVLSQNKAVEIKPKPSQLLIQEAIKQVGVTVKYDPSYSALAFPKGDVPREKGVCSDVIIRAYRDAFDIDFQPLLYKDMSGNFALYPKKWGLKTPDKNIDHRRVLNLQAFLKRQGAELPISSLSSDYLAGDIVSQVLPGNLPHIVIVSDKKTILGTPLVIHNIGQGTQEEDSLFRFKITGHYRYFPMVK